VKIQLLNVDRAEIETDTGQVVPLTGVEAGRGMGSKRDVSMMLDIPFGLRQNAGIEDFSTPSLGEQL